MKIKLLSPTARIPKRATSGSSGYDVFAARAVRVPARGRALIPLDVAVELPPQIELQIRPRSGMSLKKGVHAIFGTVDNDYRGPVGVILFNESDAPFHVSVGDRVAQAVPVWLCELSPIEVVDTLTSTNRGSGGFGSTGK
jgi:dUTP pyrophosphatase